MLETSGKRIYVIIMRGLRSLGHATGLLTYLKRKSDRSRTAHWLLSLFYIHDIDGLMSLNVPWWTYDAIDEVEAFLKSRPHAKAYEFGSGASTIWLAQRVNHLSSVEHDENWFPIVKERLAACGAKNADLQLIKPDPVSTDSLEPYGSEKPGNESFDFRKYATSILEHDEKFDLVVVDGRARPACLKHALEKLAQGGMIVFDNSGRSRYQDAIQGSGLQIEKHAGRAPSLPYSDETTLLKAVDP